MTRNARSRLIVLLTPLLAGTLCRTAQAGFLKVTDAVPGSQIIIRIISGDSESLQQETATADGTFTFGLGKLEEEKKITEVVVTKIPKGQTKFETGSVVIKPGTTTIAALEPFEFPAFSALVSLFASIDIAAFLSEPAPFGLGDVLSVTDGVIAETSTITFAEGSSPFTGFVTVSSFDEFLPVPEPGGFSLLGICTLGLIGLCWLRRRPA